MTRLAFGSAGKQKASSEQRPMDLTVVLNCFSALTCQSFNNDIAQATETLNPEPDMATIDPPLFTWFLYPGAYSHLTGCVHV